MGAPRTTFQPLHTDLPLCPFLLIRDPPLTPQAPPPPPDLGDLSEGGSDLFLFQFHLWV